MTNKILSLLVFLCVVVVLLWGDLNPSNPLFFFISSNRWLSICRLLIGGSLVWITFSHVLTTDKLKKYARYAGLGMMAGGVFLFFLTQVQTALFDYLKPLDLLLLIEAGVIYSSVSLAPASTPKQRTSHPLARPSLNLKAASKVFSIT